MYNMQDILHKYNCCLDECEITRATNGLSNEVFIITNKTRTFILRVFKHGVYNNIIDKICNVGLCPKILFRCETGTIEEYISGKTMSYDEMISDNYSHKIAHQMRLLHDAGFVHLDITHVNIIIDTNDNVRLIDFEYAEMLTEDTRMLDIANHCCEWFYDFDQSDWFNPKRIDNFIHKIVCFCTVYLGREPSIQFMKDIFKSLCVSRERWIQWALVRYEQTGDDTYLKYANGLALVINCIRQELINDGRIHV
jgi:thiamine kinase-like enzyme